MKEEMIKLQKLREQVGVLKESKKITYEQYLLDNKELFDGIEEMEASMSQTITDIKNKALDQYEKTGEKKLEFGVGIRILNKLDYGDDEALTWAKDHNMALSLDKRAFDKIAKADPMDFVVIHETPQATIPSKIEI